MQRSSERQNLKYIRRDRYQACETVICQHYRSIYSFMVYLAGNTSLAEDLTQETFTAAWAGIDNFRSGASLKTWLHRIAYNKFIDSKRQMKRNAALKTKLSKDVAEVAQTPNPLNCLIADENSALFYEALHKLEPPEYLLIVLHYFQDLSFRQMAKVLEQPAGTVKWRISRTLKKLRMFLSSGVQ